jgi:hypothetical protein
MLITLIVFVAMMMAVLSLFDMSNKIARAQVHVSDMQQSLRVSQYEMVRNTRIAGRGWILPADFAVVVRDDVAANQPIVAGSTNPNVIIAEGTDVLTLRGVITGSLYEVNSPNSVADGSVTIAAVSPLGIKQDLGSLKEADADEARVAVLLVANSGLVAAVEFNPTASSWDNVKDEFTLAFTTSGTYSADYDAVPGTSSAWVADARNQIRMVGLLEELRYYIRDDPSKGPRLAYARVYPNTEVAYDTDDANLQLDVADDILDLQIALGFETTDANTTVDEVGAAKDDDEWQFNFGAGEATPAGDLYYVRISTLARTHREDFNYIDAPIASIENHGYNEPATPAVSDVRDRRHRRRLITTPVDLRNL